MGEGGRAHHAALPHQHANAAECALVARHVVAQAVEDRCEDVGEAAGLGLVQAAVDAVDVVAQIDRDPRGLGLHLDADAHRNAIGQDGLHRIVRALRDQRRGGQPRDRPRHALLGVIQPILHEGRDGFGAVARAKRLEAPFADPCRADQGKEVAAPLLGHADAPLAHAHDIVVDGAVPLHEHAGEDERPLLVHVAGEGVVGGGLAVADVGLVRLGAGGEHVAAVDEHRHQDGVIGRVGVAEVGVVVEEGVALPQLRMKRAHGPRLQVAAEDVHGQALCGGDQAVVMGEQRAGKILGRSDDAGARRAEQRVRHLAHDGFDPPRENGRGDRIPYHPGRLAGQRPLYRSAAPAAASKRSPMASGLRSARRWSPAARAGPA